MDDQRSGARRQVSDVRD